MSSIFVDRSDILAALVSAAYSGHDRAALFAVALALSVERDFVKQVEQLPRIIESQSERKKIE